MRQVTRFAAADGTEFISEGACAGYESVCAEIGLIVLKLNAPPPSGDAAWVQQDPQIFLSVQRDLVLIFERLHPNMVDEHTEWARNASVSAGMTLMGRYMDDCGPLPLYRAWNRMMCTDRKFREWGQPYYAIQSDKRQ